MRAKHLPPMASPVLRASSGRLPSAAVGAAMQRGDGAASSGDAVAPSIIGFGLPFSPEAVGPSFFIPPLPFADDAAE